VVDAASVALPVVPGGAGLLIRGAAKVDDLADTARAAANVVESALSSTESSSGLLYRAATGSPDSLTPRTSDIVPGGGLSFWDSIDKIGPGEKYVAVDPQKLKTLEAFPDNNPTGHVTVRPKSLESLQDWGSSRGTGNTHPLTQEVLNAVVYRGKTSKAE
jgi:hypothetical protein